MDRTYANSQALLVSETQEVRRRGGGVLLSEKKKEEGKKEKRKPINANKKHTQKNQPSARQGIGSIVPTLSGGGRVIAKG